MKVLFQEGVAGYGRVYWVAVSFGGKVWTMETEDFAADATVRGIMRKELEKMFWRRLGAG